MNTNVTFFHGNVVALATRGIAGRELQSKQWSLRPQRHAVASAC